MRKDTRELYPKNWHEISVKTIKERGGKCEHCNTKGNPLNPLTVHHKDYNPANNNPDNLIVLCAKCHLRLQNKKGERIKRAIVTARRMNKTLEIG